ncbi:MAG TPA: glycyl-radical enzyme activating protein [Albitalea sp.]|nr:glycyl-radical enzyme activating protein [Albitalea sp.]
MESSAAGGSPGGGNATVRCDDTKIGITFNLQQFSTEDGPGIRTTVFLKGCPLHCEWCHNPEGMRAAPDLMWYDVRCLAARECLKACPKQALALSASGMQIDREHCTLCGECVKACPAAAFELIGRHWSADELLAELLKDRVFYAESGGGVTFSGGEPLAQIDFLCEVLPLCKSEALHVALDTCGAVAGERFLRVLPWVDLVLYDLKVMDAAISKGATGVSNELILENARLLAGHGTPMWIRTPIVPGWSADTNNIRAIACFIRDHLPTVQRWDLLAYTNLGRPKYHRLDRPYGLEHTALPTRDEMQALWQVAVEIVPQVQWSGATRCEARG